MPSIVFAAEYTHTRTPGQSRAGSPGRSHIPTAATFITEPAQAEHILRTRQTHMVFLARALLRDPYWPLRAARELGVPVPYPVQYDRAWR